MWAARQLSARVGTDYYAEIKGYIPRLLVNIAGHYIRPARKEIQNRESESDSAEEEKDFQDEIADLVF